MAPLLSNAPSGSRTQNRGSIPPYSLTYNEVSGITFYYPNINLILVWCALEDSLWGATSSRLLGESGTRGSTPAAPPPMLAIKSFSHRHSEAEIAGQPLQPAPIRSLSFELRRQAFSSAPSRRVAIATAIPSKVPECSPPTYDCLPPCVPFR